MAHSANAAAAQGGKHPLQCSWTLWYTGPGTNQASWTQALTALLTVSTVEDFWGAYNNILPVRDLEMGSSYYFFKEGVKPEWEDTYNSNGGAWTIQFPARLPHQDDLFLNTLLAMIGASFQRHDEICGIIFAARRMQNRLSLWTKTASDQEAQESLGQQLRELLQCEAGALAYKGHMVTSHKERALYTV